MIPPTTISAFLDEFERALKLSGRRRRRVLDEARDHLIEARERGISAGMDPFAAEIAAVEAFGDAAGVASRFDPGRLAYLSHRVSGAVDRFDRWRAVHPTAGITVFIAPMALAMAVLWSPLAAALCFFGPWASMSGSEGSSWSVRSQATGIACGGGSKSTLASINCPATRGPFSAGGRVSRWSSWWGYRMYRLGCSLLGLRWFPWGGSSTRHGGTSRRLPSLPETIFRALPHGYQIGRNT